MACVLVHPVHRYHPNLLKDLTLSKYVSIIVYLHDILFGILDHSTGSFRILKTFWTIPFQQGIEL